MQVMVLRANMRDTCPPPQTESPAQEQILQPGWVADSSSLATGFAGRRSMSCHTVKARDCLQGFTGATVGDYQSRWPLLPVNARVLQAPSL